MMEAVDRISRRWDSQVFTVAHVGDSNLHPNIAYDPRNLSATARAHLAVFDLL